jgi:xanthine/uracil permease
MDRPDKTSIYLEHYKLMRQEVLQNSAESIKALELGIAVVSALFALASSTVIPENARWLFFLFPPIVVSPLIMLIAQRFRQTRKIGAHIGQQIEPELGIIWEGTPQNTVSQGTQPVV